MDQAAQDSPVFRVLDRLDRVRRTGAGWTARCPAHADRTPSLSVTETDDGKVLLNCHAGCAADAVISALGLKWVDLFPPDPSRENGHAPKIVRGGRGGNGHRQVAVYEYLTAEWAVSFQVVRYEPKDFRQRRPDGHGGWEWKGGNLDLPYRLPELNGTPADGWVFVVEGEKDADTLWRLGLTATCNAGGAGKWRTAHAECLAGRRVAILPDNDEPGRSHALDVARSLVGKATALRLVELPDLPPKGDVSDWLAAGGTADGLVHLAEETTDWQPPPAARCWQRPWPAQLGEAAYWGLTGEVVRALGPHSEADPAALLLNFLAAFGSCVGSGPHMFANEDRHAARIWAVLVGESYSGRKGSSWSPVLRLFERADLAWAVDRVAPGGLSSGQGLIFHVRDPLDVETETEGGGRRKKRADEGVQDKRLMVVESEFASTLAISKMESSILSAVMRQAWDRGDLRTLTRKDPLKATGAHVTIVGHVTRADLSKHLAETDLANGFANRFLWACVRRSKSLPEGGRLGEGAAGELGRRLRRTLDEARRVGEMERDQTARTLWAEQYDRIGESGPGLLGAVTARAVPQVLRLSMTYALLDGTGIIRREHLAAALEVWRYCRESAAYVFGDATGDSVADRILAALRETGPLTRWEINERLGGHTSSAEIVRALELLRQLDRVTVVTGAVGPRGGRPSETWESV